MYRYRQGYLALAVLERTRHGVAAVRSTHTLVLNAQLHRKADLGSAIIQRCAQTMALPPESRRLVFPGHSSALVKTHQMEIGLA